MNTPVDSDYQWPDPEIDWSGDCNSNYSRTGLLDNSCSLVSLTPWEAEAHALVDGFVWAMLNLGSGVDGGSASTQ